MRKMEINLTVYRYKDMMKNVFRGCIFIYDDMLIIQFFVKPSSE